MKLSELTTERALDALCELTPYLNNIITDENFWKEVQSKLPKGENNRQNVLLFGAKKINKLIPMLLKEHRKDIYGILAIINEQDVEKVAKQNVLQTAKQIRDLFKDEELLDFFKSCVPQEKAE